MGIQKVNATDSISNNESFANILSEAFSDAQETDSVVQQENENLLTGENDSIHTSVIASEKSELALSLAIQIRNKVVDAYNEVMRMQL
jgi:flagellar hook-basal body complex protein FliE